VRYSTGDSPIIANHSNMKRKLICCHFAPKVFSQKLDIAVSKQKFGVGLC